MPTRSSDGRLPPYWVNLPDVCARHRSPRIALVSDATQSEPILRGPSLLILLRSEWQFKRILYWQRFLRFLALATRRLDKVLVLPGALSKPPDCLTIVAFEMAGAFFGRLTLSIVTAAPV